MMKKLSLSILFILLAFQADSFAWGRLGHSTILEIASRHLTPEARKNIAAYTSDPGSEPSAAVFDQETLQYMLTDGLMPAAYSYWLDVVTQKEPYKTEFKGWHASVALPDCTSPLYIRRSIRSCRDGVTAMDFFREYLKDYKSLPDSTVRMAIKCVVHIVGDFHCPQHVRFTDNQNEGKFPVVFNGVSTTYHKVWDYALVEKGSGLRWSGYAEFADRLDTWNRRQIKAVQKGWAREWFEDVARDVRPTVGTVVKNDVLTDEWAKASYPLAELEMRKAGYRLAAALNEIFGR